MKKIVIEKPGGYDRLMLNEFPTPKPGKGEVLIETKGCGVNFADCLVRMGLYSSAKEFVGWPITPGFEVSGVIADVGEKVTRWEIGDKVVAMTLFGGYSTHLIVPEALIFPLPAQWDFAQGASVPTVFLTAYYALFVLANAQKGDRVLIHSAAGGVGSSLMQFAKGFGCHAIGVVGASHKVDYVKSLGAEAVIDKSSQDLWKEAKRLAPKGYDIVLDANGTETLKQSYQHLAPGGRLVTYGFHSLFSKGRGKPNWLKILWLYLKTPTFNPLNMITENRSVLAFNLSYLMPKQHLLQNSMAQILKWVHEGKVIPPRIKTYPLEEAARAHQDLESGQTVGKIILIT